MYRTISKALVITLLLTSFAFAQRSSARASHGFGNVVFPGTGGPPPLPRQGPSFAQQLGATVAGRPQPGVRPGLGGRSNRGPVFVPYAYPVYVGGYGDPYQQQQPQVVVVQSPPQNQQPVIINNYIPETANPVMKQYKEGDLPPASDLRSYEAPGPTIAPERSTIIEDKATIYLIVYKDQSVHPSLAYWVKEDTLHYITLQGTHNRVSLGLVDVPYSEKLNRERKVEFTLASPK